MARFSLKTKMTAATFLLTAGIATLFGFLALNYYEYTLKDSISRQQYTMLATVAEDLDTKLTRARQVIIETAAGIPPEILKDPDQLQEFLNFRLGVGTQSLFDNGIFLFGADGRMIAEYPSRPERRGRDYSFRDYFRQTVASGKPHISAPYFSSQSHNHPAINFTAPVLDTQGRLAAVLAGSVDLTRKNFLGGLSQVRIGKSGYLYLYGTDRLMIMHPEPSRILQRDVPPGVNRLFDQAIEGFEGTGETINSRGVSMLASFKRLQNVEWILAANYPLAEAYAPVYEARRIFAIGVVGVLFISTFAAWFFMAYLTAPLNLFLGHLRELTENSGRRQPLPIRTQDEIGTLTESFNRLMTEVEEQKRLSREQFGFLQTMMDTIPAPVYYKNIEGRYLGCNRAFENMFGNSRGFMIGRTVHDLIPGPMAAEIAAEDADLFSNPGQFQALEKSLTCPDGTTHEIICYKDVFLHEDATPGGLVGTIVDISQRKAYEGELHRQREFFENLLQNSAVPCFVLDERHHVIIWTRACEELTGVPAAQLIGTDRHWQAFYTEKRPCLADLVLEGNLEQTLDLYDRFADSPLIPEGVQAEKWFPKLTGKARYLLIQAAPIRDDNGAVVAAITTLHDLTGLKLAEQALRESEENYRSLIERLPDAVIVHRGGRIVFANQGAGRLFSAASAAALSGVRIMDLVPRDFRRIVSAGIRTLEADRTENLYSEGKILRLDGTAVDVESGSTAVFYGGIWAVQTILRDITDRKELQEKIWRQANFDSLTGIPNRPMFQNRLQFTIDQAEREKYHVALFFIDLDHFKKINDNLGHAAGDALLREAAQRLSAVLRKTDTLARMGGDEFTVIMPRLTEPPMVSTVARRILQALAAPFQLPGGEGCISASIGIAVFPEDGVDIDTLMKHADIAMYRAKDIGRNTFAFFTPGRIIKDQPAGREPSTDEGAIGSQEGNAADDRFHQPPGKQVPG